VGAERQSLKKSDESMGYCHPYTIKRNLETLTYLIKILNKQSKLKKFIKNINLLHK